MAIATDDATAIRAAAGGAEKRAYVRQIFSEIAPRYDFANHVLSLNIDRIWRRKAIAELALERDPEGTYLDLCAGTMDISVMIGRAKNFRGSVVSADFAEPMLREGRGKIGRSKISPVAADALDLPLPAESMSGAIVAFGIRNVAGVDSALTEVRRVLVPGGRFVILEFSRPDSAVLNALYQLYFKRVLPGLGSLISGHPTAYRYLPDSVSNFPTREELARRMRSAGFSKVSWQPVTFGVAAIHVGERPGAPIAAGGCLSYDTLSEFIEAIDGAGELARVSFPVAAKLELCEIADRVMKRTGGGRALLFENVTLDDGTRSPYPVAINLFGSMRRMCLALGVDHLDDIGARITELVTLKVPDGLMGKLSLLPRLLEIAQFPPRVKGGKPACQQIVWEGEQVDLRKLPIITCWPEDGGPYITLPMVISRDPKRGIRNVGMYRVQVLGPNTLAMHWQRHKVGAAHWREMAAAGQTMPVCIAIGGDPASIYSASAPLPPTIDEFIFAGFLRKDHVTLARALTCDLEVPADAEFVIEGHIDPSEELVVEGPFGDHTGFYSEADLYPLVHVTAVTMRRSPVYATTIVGRPPMEDYYLGHATERIFLPLLKLTIPEIVDYHMPAEGIFHNLVFVSIDKQFPGQAYKVMNAMWGQGLMSLAKVLVILDKEVNVQDEKEAWWIALNNIDPERDVRFSMGPMDVLDHSSRAFTYGSKMGIDATRKWPEEGFTRNWPKLIEMDEITKKRVDAIWGRLGLGR